METEVDLVVIGGGSGGVRAARIAANHGARVVLCESDRMGGTCVIRGCIPKKLFVYAAEFSHTKSDGAAYGWEFASPRFDWATLQKNKDAEIERLSGLYRENLSKAGVTIVAGRARLADAHTVLVDATTRLRAGTILIATGGRPTLPALPGIELALSSDEMFELERLPERVLIVGGGYIGVEFASILAGLGCRVTMLLRRDRVLRGFDDDLRDEVTRGLAELGVDIMPERSVTRIEREAGGALAVQLNEGRPLAVDQLLFAVGREPNTGGLGLQEAGVRLGERGAVLVDARSRTSVPNMYAIGDCTDRVNLTPVAIREGHAFADSVFGARPTEVDYRAIPSAIFSRPPAASVGLSESQGEANFGAIDVYKTGFRPLFHTMTGRNERVMMKLVVDRATDVLLGAHMVGPGAPEIIQCMAIAVKCGIKKSQLDEVTALHPTIAEELVLLRQRHSR